MFGIKQSLVEHAEEVEKENEDLKDEIDKKDRRIEKLEDELAEALSKIGYCQNCEALIKLRE